MKDFQPCLKADSQRGQQLVHRAMRFLPHGSEREVNGGNRCGKSLPAYRSKAAKSRFGLFFGVVVMTASFC